MISVSFDLLTSNLKPFNSKLPYHVLSSNCVMQERHVKQSIYQCLLSIVIIYEQQSCSSQLKSKSLHQVYDRIKHIIPQLKCTFFCCTLDDEFSSLPHYCTKKNLFAIYDLLSSNLNLSMTHILPSMYSPASCILHLARETSECHFLCWGYRCLGLIDLLTSSSRAFYSSNLRPFYNLYR